jgi:hypothetical protein
MREQVFVMAHERGAGGDSLSRDHEVHARSAESNLLEVYTEASEVLGGDRVEGYGCIRKC